VKTRLHTLCLLGAAAVLGLTVASSVPASASPAPVTVHLADGETITHYSNGNVLVTAPMHLKTKIKGRVVPDGYGQDNGDCGVSKLWTYASNHTYQLSLIGDPGIVLGNGWADTSTDGFGEIPSFIGISTNHQTWTSGRQNIWPGLFPSEAATVGADATSAGECIIAVAAPWS